MVGVNISWPACLKDKLTFTRFTVQSLQGLHSKVVVMGAVSNPKIQKLLKKYRSISLLEKTKAVLEWDLNVNLPPKASRARARQIAFITQLLTRHWQDPQLRKLIEEAAAGREKLTPIEKAILRNLEYQAQLYFKVPAKIIVERARVTAKAFPVWKKAKEESRFQDFAPYLQRIVWLSQEIAQYLGYEDNPYDALLNLYEPQLRSKGCEEIFSQLQPALTKLLTRIQNSPQYSRAHQQKALFEQFTYPQATQRKLALFVLRRMGYDLKAGRLDSSAHPFTIDFSPTDVRITIWFRRNDLRSSLMAAMHEGGHALYEQGIPPELEQTPLESGVSLGIHESQSRFWENQVGRSLAWGSFLFPILEASFANFPRVELQDFLLYLNWVEPGLIRVEADEVTYNLHIILRFELENALINEQIKVEDLPEMWREKMQKYLGVEPTHAAEGILQDVHWSLGYLGYFPTYTLGNLYAAQFAQTMREEIDLEELLSRGELSPLLNWLREKIHRHGSTYWPQELCQRVTGQKLQPHFFLEYLQHKFQQIYEY